MAESLGLEITSASILSDADWAVIGQLCTCFVERGEEAFSAEIERLSEKDFDQYARIFEVFFPKALIECVRDELAARGVEENDLSEAIRQAGSRAH